MKKPKLVVMAAGLGSRFGGLKQMEPITDENEIILDFACYDAVKAGFEDIIFVIKPEMEELFEERVLAPMEKHVDTSYVFQSMEQLPEGYSVPEGRSKPWGTCHAVMAARDLLDGPFAVINSDDYYGKDAFKKVYDFMTANSDENTFCMAGYRVENTLSDQGAVTRGICETENGYVTQIDETRGIERGKDGKIIDAEGHEIAEGTIVSMNFWGFTEKMMDEMVSRFPVFLDNDVADDPMKAEYLLPVEVGRLLSEGKCRVRVLETADKWYGVTYKEDKEIVTEAFKKMKASGKYPQKLWK
ncbi:sugar phosphate nucleotidyltransferase [Gallibacter sp. Marseille-QA0791]|uniref:sugar phosphate nucleotidyltransferase n=1 Tax=Gallibacter sp. Marseille-QA0791 TaxID=3378781 RepID=UPI003D0D1596